MPLIAEYRDSPRERDETHLGVLPDAALELGPHGAWCCPPPLGKPKEVSPRGGFRLAVSFYFILKMRGRRLLEGLVRLSKGVFVLIDLEKQVLGCV